MEYLNLIPTKDCTGCSACLNICPVSCISMRQDSKGFLYPQVDMESCIQCQSCEDACPVKNADRGRQRPRSQFYGCKHKDDKVRRESSSGGFFYELARNVIESGGVVFGAAFTEGFHKVVHRSACTMLELESLRVSKYVQSDTSAAYHEVKTYLDGGRTVLFSGTPCQVAGLRGFLDKEYERLLLAEVVCHGVPSPKVWDLYLTGIEEGGSSRLEYVSFRDKSRSWRQSDFLAIFEDGSEFRQPNSVNPYMKAFINNLSIRTSCTDCKFKSFASGADITMGDFWGSTELGPSYTDDIGISVIAVNSSKGRSFFDAVARNMKDVISLTEKSAFVFNESYAISAKKNDKSETFFRRISASDFGNLVLELTSEPQPDASVSQTSWVSWLLKVYRRLKI